MTLVLQLAEVVRANPDRAAAFVVTILLVLAVRPFALTLKAVPRNAPTPYRGHGWFGSLQFATDREEYLRTGKQESNGGQFSFWYGSNHIVALSGNAARVGYMTARGLDSLSGWVPQHEENAKIFYLGIELTIGIGF